MKRACAGESPCSEISLKGQLLQHTDHGDIPELFSNLCAQYRFSNALETAANGYSLTPSGIAAACNGSVRAPGNRIKDFRGGREYGHR